MRMSFEVFEVVIAQRFEVLIFRIHQPSPALIDGVRSPFARKLAYRVFELVQ